MTHSTFSPASEMTSSTVLTGRAEGSGALFRYNFCVGAVTLESFRIVEGAGVGALFNCMTFSEDVVVGSGEQSALVLSGGILSRSIGNAWITH
jgi:hypothetical protein